MKKNQKGRPKISPDTADSDADSNFNNSANINCRWVSVLVTSISVRSPVVMTFYLSRFGLGARLMPPRDCNKVIVQHLINF
jgi:hypothetical protein